ncbi:DUF6274 family protein [Streptomyces sp. NBC_00264]|uniref:DUF6274 family protein n=1 Tax=unclassified Streptomyces TaxID=2593676 RepID=UPI000F5BF3C0|nr:MULTISPECIES: DUF6274 family protein [unclassified Streptomyces]WSX02873.1 DUF6274 family protein [Streptomyces sp. NBC_00987]MCX4395197.1 DUF6274 family protein [Streptomyces sp. NBC_01767]MCX5102155.1 DUF6274 family protein [Streptomyces sp. NBC_00439]MCX5161690.1 DUF6274 family protein [Streptomyces sp. NBC_00305]MCX5220213.1 DUF6274 family protein [Streptomyces sp. NBC_00264]
MTTSATHETRALLRAHLAAASGRRHLTRHCAVCHRLLRLVMEPVTARRTDSAPEPPALRTERQEDAPEVEDESPPGE